MIEGGSIKGGTLRVQVIGKNGQPKPIWNENKWGEFFRKYFKLNTRGIKGLGEWKTFRDKTL